jgi:RNA polymerase sigma-70 factor (ECF subfamily)
VTVAATIPSGRPGPPPPPGGRRDVPDPLRDVVGRARAGDAAAFSALFARYQQPIWHYLYRLFGDAADADEFAQDTFLKAYRALPATSSDLCVGPWLYRIATNTALDAFRHRRLVRWEPLERASPPSATGLETLAAARQPCPDDEAGGGPTVRQHSHPLVDQDRRADPERAALDSELAAAVRGILGRLPRRYRVCLELRDYQGLTYDEIAAQLGMTLAAVKSTLFRARQEFRHQWQTGRARPPAP